MAKTNKSSNKSNNKVKPKVANAPKPVPSTNWAKVASNTTPAPGGGPTSTGPTILGGSKTKIPQNGNWASIERESTAKAHAEELRQQKAQVKMYAELVEELQGQLDVVCKLADSPITRATIDIPSHKKGTGEATAFAIASDWHVEETVRPETVNGLNDFNLTVADQRIEKFFSSVLRLVEIERAGTDIDKLVLGLLGDFMSGYIHEELVENNSMSPVEALVWVQERILKGINTLRKHGGFKRIIIPCCYGNHGRTTQKSRISTGAKNSFEWLMYKWLAQTVTDGVEWQIASGYHTYIEVYGKTIRLHHGDGLKFQGGVGGLTIPVEKAIASWNRGYYADLDIFGHWHQMQQNPKWISNGCLIGYGPYALSIKAPYETPQQTFFLFDSKRGRTGTWPIHLQDI
jgi:hypothetical protein